jgi:hypothetical protein
MSLGKEFTTSWVSFKKFVAKTDQWLGANLPKVQQGVLIAEKVAVAVDPALAPAVTVFDVFEEALAGEVAAAFHTGSALTNATTGETVVTLSAELSAIVKHLADTLAGHPAVVDAKKAA